MSNQLSIALCVVCTMIGYAYADIEKCTEPIKHYKELGCHPAVEEGKHCPTRYICPYIPHFEPDVCHYKEVMYYTTQRLADEVTADQCVQKCVCSDEATPRAFKCKEINCPHNTGKIDPTQCVDQYKYGNCCPHKYLCGKTSRGPMEKSSSFKFSEEHEIDALAQCKYDDEIYLEGEKFYPEKEKCFSCICHADFDGSQIRGNKYCREIDCGIELRFFNELRNGCIPIYYEDRCCPTDWKCPEPTDQVQRNGYRGGNPFIYCKFGDLKLKIGDTLKTEDKCLKCTCAIPPMAHCMVDDACLVSEEDENP